MNAHGEAIDADTDLVLNAHKIGVGVERSRVLQLITELEASWEAGCEHGLGQEIFDAIRAKVASGAQPK